MRNHALQRALADHLRDPGLPPPPGVHADVALLYRRLIRNTFVDVLDRAYPVLSAMVGADAWSARIDEFMAVYACPSPQIHELPAAFLRYMELHARGRDEPWCYELALWEHLELELMTAPDVEDVVPSGVRLCAHTRIGAFDYPVHRLSTGVVPDKADRAICLMMWRDTSHTIRFMSLDHAMFRLLATIDAARGRVRGDVIAIAFPGEPAMWAGASDALDRMVALGVVRES